MPSIDHVRVWGCKCYSYVNPKSLPAASRHDKLMDTGRVAVFVGYDENTTKQYQVYAPDMHTVIKASVVRFDENAKGGDINLKLPPPISTGKAVIKAIRPAWNGDSNAVPDRNPRGRPRKVLIPSHPEATCTHTEPDQSEEAVKVPESVDTPTITHAQEPPLDQSENGDLDNAAATRQFVRVEIPKRQRDEEEDDTANEHIAKHIRCLLAMAACEGEQPRVLLYQIPVPSTYEQAVQDVAHGNEWKSAIQAEVNALEANGTWEFVKRPENVNLVTNKWGFDVKYSTQGAVERYKARLVARGFSQIYGVDYNETFAPTIKLDTLRAVMAIVALENL